MKLLPFSYLSVVGCLSLILFGSSGKCQQLQAQEQSDSLPSIMVSGSIDLYYADYFRNASSNSMWFSGGISPRNRQFGLNLLQTGVFWEQSQWRGELVLQLGDIPSTAWSQEFPMIQKGIIGINIGNHVAIDAGLFPTHIGVESAQPMNNRLSSISVMTNFEPFYQSGLRLGYTSEQLDAQLHLLNGYNTFIDRDENKAVGLYLGWQPSDALRISYANIVGNEQSGADSRSRFQMYHSIGLIGKPIDWVEVIAGFDYGSAERVGVVSGGLITFSVFPFFDWRVSSRLEFFQDREGILAGMYETTSGDMIGPELYGITTGVEHRPTEVSYVRIEGRWLKSREKMMFLGEAPSSSEQFSLMLTAGYSFTLLLSP